MKSEERHKLQQNELADYLIKGAAKIKPYQNAILGGIILVLVIILLIHWRNGSSEKVVAAANTQFSTALDNSLTSGEPSELQGVVKDYSNVPVATLAALTAADSYLNNGSTLLFKDKAKANVDLGKAADLYQEWLPKLTQPLLSARARFGLARVKECQNLLSEAEKNYKEVMDKWPEGPYGVLAARRLEDLKRPATKLFYDNKFAKYEPTSFKDDSGISDKMPLFDPKNLPKEPVYQPGSFGEKMGVKDTDLKSNSLFKDKNPLEEDKKADETKPASDEKPAAPTGGETPTTTPPTPETPAATTPAPETPAPAQNPPSENKPEPAVNGK
jgi:hypothetical protein